MKRVTSSRISTAIAVTSLFVALGGPAQATSLITGARIKNGSITTSDIRNSSLTGIDVKNSSLTGSDIRSNSLSSGDITGIRSGDVKDGSLLRSDFARGQLPAGATGPTGPVGPAAGLRWLTVNAAGQIEAQSGGFRIASAYRSAGAGVADAANGNVYIESGDKDLSDNAIVATLALENQVDQDGIAGNAGANDGAGQGNPEWAGEISASRCAIPGQVVCAPLDMGVTPNVSTNASSYFVVSPRLSDGRRTTDGASPSPSAVSTRKRFSVIVAGDRQ